MNLVERIEEQFPHVHITFLSVLVGFALEDLVSIIRETDLFFQGGIGSTIVWLQALNCLFAIVVAWLAYTLTAMSRRAVPSPMDTFNILCLASTLFLLNSMLGQPLWMWNLSLAFYLAVGGLATLFSAKQMQKENEKFKPFVEKVVSLKGPLLLNVSFFPFLLVIAFLTWRDIVPDIVHVFLLASGAPAFVLFISLIYKYWREFLAEHNPQIDSD